MHAPRRRLIDRVRATLERDGYPRLQMLLLVTITGAAGFIASYALLRLGLTEMWLRYLAAFGLAYLVFLALLGLWLRTRASDYVDVPDLLPSRGGGCHDAFAGQGGQFSGAGASGSFDSSEAMGQGGSSAFEATRLDSTATAEPNGAASIGDGLGGIADADELAIPLAVLGLLLAFALSSLWIVYSAPILFAELLVDGALAASLYRRLRGIDARHWIETAVRRTAMPFAAAAVVTALIGFGMAQYAPGAHSVGDVLAQAKSAK